MKRKKIKIEIFVGTSLYLRNIKKLIVINIYTINVLLIRYKIRNACMLLYCESIFRCLLNRKQYLIAHRDCKSKELGSQIRHLKTATAFILRVPVRMYALGNK